MPLTIEELLINLGADVTGFKNDLASASTSLDGLAVSGRNVQVSLSGIEGAAGRVEGALSPVSQAAGDIAASFLLAGDASKKITFKELGSAAAAAASNLRDIGSAGASSSAGVATVAEAAKLTSEEIRSLSRRALQGGQDLLQLGLSGSLSASNLLIAVRGTKDLAGTLPSLTAGSGALTSLATTAAAIAPPVAAAAAAFVAFEATLSHFSAEVAKQNAKIAAANKVAAESFKNLKEEADKLHFDASLTALSDLDAAIVRSNVAITEEGSKIAGAGGVFAQGEEAARKSAAAADILKEHYADAFKAAARESQAAAAALGDSGRQGVDDALAELGRLERGNAGVVGQIIGEYGRIKDAMLPLVDGIVKITPSGDVLQRFRDLGKSLDFKGPLAEMQKLQAALDANEAKVREVASANGLGEEFIRKEIAKTNALLKQRFKTDIEIGLQVDPTAAKAEVDRFVKEIAISDQIELTPTLKVQDLTAQLSTLKSRIADTPEGELKLALKAEASHIQAQIKDEKNKIANDKATLPVDADLTEAEKALKKFRQEAQQAAQQAIDKRQSDLGLGLTNDQVNSLKTIGESAQPTQIKAAADDAVRQYRAAVQSGNLDLAKQVAASAQQFINDFGASIRFISNLPSTELSRLGNGPQLNLAALSELQNIVQFANAPGGVGRTTGLGGDGLSLLGLGQQQTNQQLQTSNDLARSSLSTLRDISSGLSSGSFASDITKRSASSTSLSPGLL